LLAYVLGGILNAVTSMRAVAVITQFTFFDQAEQQFALYGAVSMMLFGVLYFAVPRLTGKAWVSGPLVVGHSILAIIGVTLLVVSLGAAGWIQGEALLDSKIAFAEIANLTRPWLLLATVAQALLLFANLLLVTNFLRTLAAKPAEPVKNIFVVSAEMEVTAS
jgi:cytochrome c oxidase cbb3-type subunit 1